MAKSVNAKAAKKTGNRRMKRTVRRTIGALCMVSAITVAAIPVPDIEAYNPANGEKIAAYGSGAFTIDDVPAADLPNCNVTDNYNATAYTIAKAGGDWQLDWQFRYYAPSGGADGYIQQYNSQYQVKNVALNYRVFSDFINITNADYKNYYDTSTAKTVSINVKQGANPHHTVNDVLTLSYPYTLNEDKTKDSNTWDTTSDNHKFFIDNLPDVYNKYKADFDLAREYETDVDPETKPVYPNAVTATYKDVYPTDEARQQFLCDQLFDEGTAMTLEMVKERVYTGETATGWNDIRVPLLKNRPTEGTLISVGGEAYSFDDTGFLAAKSATICGIEPNAFKGVKNVETLTMDDHIRYIGNNAFEDSFVQSVTFSKDATIGNRAFKNCNSLASITIPKGVTTLGAECFAGTVLTGIDIPSSVTVIGDGAFYNCQKMTSVNFQSDGSLEQKIGDGAFFNCIGLNDVNFNTAQITELGYGCFAVDNNETGNLTVFDMPDYIVNGAKIGDYLLANRLKLNKVIMPNNLKGNGQGGADISSTFVSKCQNLGCVEFPDSANLATFDPTTFYDVVNKEFYVRGPKLDNNNNVAKPRSSAWVALFNAGSSDSGTTYVGTPVPYVYNEDGKDYYEVCRDEDEDHTADYIMCIDQDGKLTSCTFPVNGTPKIVGATEELPFTIPASVGPITVKSLGEGCFEDTSVLKGVKDYIKYLKIEDGSGINGLDDGIFAGAKELVGVDLGDSVATIGNSTFEACPKLKDVTIGKNIASIGDKAFKDCKLIEDIYFEKPDRLDIMANIGSEALSTGGEKLTVHGEISPEYKPFAWSMAADNYVNPDGCRVCYKNTKKIKTGDGEAELDLHTVIVDNTNLMPTLVDYLHYEDLPESIKTKIDSGAAMTNDEQEVYNAVYNVRIPDGVKSIDVAGFINRKSTESDPLTKTNATGKTNGMSVNAYLKNKLPNDRYQTYADKGLFNGYYADTSDATNKKSYTYTKADEYYMSLLGDSSAKAGTSESLWYEDVEKNPIGNDHVTSVVMSDVKYLPDLAFYNCERLGLLSLGDDIEYIGALPIADCTSLASIGIGNDNFTSENGMLYENLPNGTKKLIECFPGQGMAVGSSDVNTKNHPELENVAEIAEGAFSNCDTINFVDLTGVDESTVPKYCFYDCDNLRDVTLPKNFDEINENAFAEDPSIILEIENPDLVLASDAFGDFVTGENPVIYTTEGSIVEKMSKKLGKNKLPAIIHYTDNEYKIYYFCGQDGCQIDIERDIVEGDHPDGPNPDVLAKHEESFAGYHQDFEFSHYADEKGTVIENLRRVSVDRDMILTLVYKPKSNTVSPDVSGAVDPTQAALTPGTTGGSSKGTTPSTTKSSSSSSTKYPLTVVYGSGSGQYPEGTKVIIEAIDAPAGKVFDKWVVTGAAATVYSSTSKATTVTTAAGETIITATYKDASSSSSSGGGGGATGTKTSTGTHNRVGADGSPIAGSGSSTRVDITKPGISDVDKAYASVSGSTDSFVVKITESADAANAVATALANKYGDMTPIKYFAMDISLYDATGTNKITDTTGLKVNVTIPIPDALRQYAGNNKVGAVVNGTQLEDLACKFTTVDGIPCVSFTATHFSPYTIYVDTNNLQVGYMDSSPKTGDPIHPKWFITIALAATSLFLFLKRDKVTIPAKAA